MRILIVNCCSTANTLYFESLSRLITLNLQTQRHVSDTQLEIVRCDRRNLPSYLYQLQTSHSTLAAMQLFEGIDIVFVIGDSAFHPWSKQMWQGNCLVRMCLRVQKHAMLISDSVFEGLVFHLVSGMTANVCLVNGPRGSDLSKEEGMKGTKNSGLYLDSVKGALYSYNAEGREWCMKKRCGLVDGRRSSTPTNLRKPQSQTNLRCYGYNQTVCRIKRQHPLFKNLPDKFIVQQRSKWRVDPETQSQLAFSCIGWDSTGVSVIQYGNVLAVHYAIDERHPETVKVLRNFIEERLERITAEPQGSRMVMVNKCRYLPTELEVQKGREILSQRLQPKPGNKPRTAGILPRPKTVGRMAPHPHHQQSSYQQHHNKPKQQPDQETTKQPLDESWTGPIVKVIPKEPLFRLSRFLAKSAGKVHGAGRRSVHPKQKHPLLLSEHLSRYRYREEEPEKWTSGYNFFC